MSSSQRSVQLSQQLYQRGLTDFLNVLDAQRVLRSARFEALAARFDQRAALIEIEQLRALDYQEKK